MPTYEIFAQAILSVIVMDKNSAADAKAHSAVAIIRKIKIFVPGDTRRVQEYSATSKEMTAADVMRIMGGIFCSYKSSTLSQPTGAYPLAWGDGPVVIFLHDQHILQYYIFSPQNS